MLHHNKKRSLSLVTRLMAIPGSSGREREVAEFVTEQLLQAGAAAHAIRSDAAHRRTPLEGDVGNLSLRLDGTRRGPRRLFSAHLDTVPICVGSEPKRMGDEIRSANPKTGLGADDRAGVAVILNTAIELLERQLDYLPLTFCWFVQEEIGLQGARCVNKSHLGRPKLAFNWDGGSPVKLTIGATGGYRMEIDLYGLASHAGGAPERGISAITISALAIADLQQQGWLGDIRKRGRHGTSNIGIIRGGDATNVVTDHVFVKAEARSHDPRFRLEIAKAIEKAFRRAVKLVKNDAGKTGRVEIESRLDYESFKLSPGEPVVQLAADAVRQVGLEPEYAIANGGLDANWLNAHGIPTVSLGCGQRNQHMTSEFLNVSDFYTACDIALNCAAGHPPQ